MNTTGWEIQKWGIFLVVCTCFSVAAVRSNEYFAVCSEVIYCEWRFRTFAFSYIYTVVCVLSTELNVCLCFHMKWYMVLFRSLCLLFAAPV
jgi:hypothetical protein